MGGKEDRAAFEGFYQRVRDDLLLQTYALTGDRGAAERGVRDALVMAWHHWRRVSQLDDAAAWVRPLAWARAQRRHTGRWWHRERDLAPETLATLDALGTLSPTQRRALLLTVLVREPLEAIAAEMGLSRAALERELQQATAGFALARDAAATSVRPMVEGLRVELAPAHWPRTPILLRAGTRRRRTHAGVGIAAVAAATLVAGWSVTDADGVSPELSARGVLSLPAVPRDGRSTSSAQATPEPPLTADVLLSAAQVNTDLGGTWTAAAPTRNTEGDGLNITCQQARFADPQGVGSLVQTFSAPVPKGRRAATAGTRTAVQSVERSVDETTAVTTYDVTRSWFGGCTSPRTQLEETYDVSGVADAAGLMVLRSWAEPASTLVVGVARTGALTTTVATTTPGTARVDVDRSARLLAAAVATTCGAPGAGTCPAAGAVPVTAVSGPVPLPAAPGMIGEVDLPPVGRVSAPWAGTEPTAANTNDAATRCDDTAFSGPQVTDATTRSFLIPGATRLPPEFGLTETVGTLPEARARAFVQRVRDRLASCAERDLGTDVTAVRNVDGGGRSLSIWKLRVEIDDDRVVDFQMAILRSGTAVAQVGFVSAAGAEMGDPRFRTLCERALDRLAAQPAPA